MMSCDTACETVLMDTQSTSTPELGPEMKWLVCEGNFFR